ncbi:MAG: HNH endonuclease [Selenomonadaceae bacterium]|nr:HNH endonuclease [Selenomonadaceae bacterium]
MTKEKQRDRRYLEKAQPAYDALMKVYPLTLENLDGEEWRPIVGYEQLYQVSNFGRVKSFCGRTPKILKPALGGGYLCVNLCIEGKTKMFLVHVLVAQAFISNPGNKPQVNHKDGWKINNCVGNLEWTTGSENMQHAYDTGLQKSGTARSDAKIKDENDVLYIRENPDGLTIKQLADKFGISETTIIDIQRGKKYKNAGGRIRPKYGMSDEIRKQIRADYATGNYTQKQLAAIHGVSQRTISRIICASTAVTC